MPSKTRKCDSCPDRCEQPPIISKNQIDTSKAYEIAPTGRYNLFSNPETVQPHNGVTLEFLDGKSLIMKYEGTDGGPSPGFLVLIKTVPCEKYNLDVTGVLKKGDLAFLKIDSYCPEGLLIDQNHSFANGFMRTFNVGFQAVSEYTLIGIFFHCSTTDYCLRLCDLKIKTCNLCKPFSVPVKQWEMRGTKPIEDGSVIHRQKPRKRSKKKNIGIPAPARQTRSTSEILISSDEETSVPVHYRQKSTRTIIPRMHGGGDICPSDSETDECCPPKPPCHRPKQKVKKCKTKPTSTQIINLDFRGTSTPCVTNKTCSDPNFFVLETGSKCQTGCRLWQCQNGSLTIVVPNVQQYHFLDTLQCRIFKVSCGQCCELTGCIGDKIWDLLTGEIYELTCNGWKLIGNAGGGGSDAIEELCVPCSLRWCQAPGGDNTAVPFNPGAIIADGSTTPSSGEWFMNLHKLDNQVTVSVYPSLNSAQIRPADRFGNPTGAPAILFVSPTTRDLSEFFPIANNEQYRFTVMGGSTCDPSTRIQQAITATRQAQMANGNMAIGGFYIYFTEYLSGVPLYGTFPPSTNYPTDAYLLQPFTVAYTLSGKDVPNLLANFQVNNTSGTAPLTVNFTDTSMGAGIVSWNWDFGDGNTSNAQNPSHTYNQAGMFTVTLRVTDNTGASSTGQKPNLVTVTDTTPTYFSILVDTTITGVGTVSNPNQFQFTGAEGAYDVRAYQNGTLIWTFKDLNGEQTITLPNQGIYELQVEPRGPNGFNRIQFNNSGDRNKLLEILSWGSNVNWTSFLNAFRLCENLGESDIVDIPNLENVTSMNRMFSGAFEFNADLSEWDVSNVIDMFGMFINAFKFNSDLSLWKVGNVIDMRNMFQSASQFNSNLSGWDVSNVTNMFSMFINASQFTSDLNGWDVGKVNNMAGMFNGASQFSSDLSQWDVSKVTNMDAMFQGASQFKSDLSNWDVRNVTNFTNFLLDVDINEPNTTINYDNLLNGWAILGNLQTGLNFHGGNSQYSAVGLPGRQSLIDTFGWNITDGGLIETTPTYFSILVNTNITGDGTVSNPNQFQFTGAVGDYDVTAYQGNILVATFDNLSGEQTINLSNPGIYELRVEPKEVNGFNRIQFFKEDEDFMEIPGDRNKLLEILSWGSNVNWTSFFHAFRGCENLGESNIADVPNLENDTFMIGMFWNASQFNADLSEWDVSKVNNMFAMFVGASQFTSNLNGWDVSNVINMAAMFWNASQFNSDLSGWKVGNVTNMSNMFQGASQFKSDLRGWDVSKVTDFNNFLFNVDINEPNTTDNYDNLLNDWATLENLKTDLNFDGGNSQYSANGLLGRQRLIDEFNWNITDGGQIQNPETTADFTANPILVTVGVPVQFTDMSTPSDSINSWLWNFGDDGTSISQNPSYSYSSAGEYTVSLKVTVANVTNTLTKENYIKVVENSIVFQDRPIPLGVSGRNTRFMNSGTLGSLVTKNGSNFILSNAHVLSFVNSMSGEAGDNITQPANGNQVIATLSNFFTDFTQQEPLNEDVALAEVLMNSVDSNGRILNIGIIDPTPYLLEELEMDQPVQKNGRTTNLTFGTIMVIDATVTVIFADTTQFQFENCIVTNNMSEPGDSGSLILSLDDPPRPVGLLFGGNESITIANGLDAIIDKYEIEWVGQVPASSKAKIKKSKSPQLQRAQDIKNKYTKDILSISGVNSIGIGHSQGRPVISVTLAYYDKDSLDQIPDNIEGVPVVTEIIGEVKFI